MKKPVLLSAALLLLVFIGTSALSDDQTKFKVKVMLSPDNIKTYDTYTAPSGSLFGGLTRLKYSNIGFDFQYISYDDYGPLLYSVNKQTADLPNHWWTLLNSKGELLPVGMGCYIPKGNEEITLKYNTKKQDHLKSHSDL